MIENLYIKNFVLIKEMNLDFETGFSVFIGETGAGKSILIDAISVLCADRAGASYVSKGADKAVIEGTFHIKPGTHAYDVLSEAGFDIQDDVTFTREISASGKNTVRIDHRIANLNLLRECLRDEVDIHGQRDNGYLLNINYHRSLLDSFAEDEQQLQDVKNAYHKLSTLQNEKAEVLNSTFNENDLEFLRYQVQEIENANLVIGEDIELEEKEQKYKAVKDSFDKLNQIFTLYDDHISGDLYEVVRLINSLKSDSKIEEIQEQVQDSYYALTDSFENLLRLKDEMDLSEDEVNEMEERLFTIQKLKRKYGRTIEDILKNKNQMQEKIDSYSNRQSYLAKIDKKVAEAKIDYEQKANILSEVRKCKSKELDSCILLQLKDLMLEHAVFQTVITPTNEPTEYGNESVEFMISMNPGEDLNPLAKTASGGELSRLMLGLKVIFTKLQGIGTVIFDEIDTGVSGPVATSIGKKMKTLSNDCQVFAVSHLAQVAACADYAYFVHKKNTDKQTLTSVTLLDSHETVDQLALIASGEITESSRKAAEELYRRNHS